MTKASHGGSLGSHRVRVVGIYLSNVAMSIGLVSIVTTGIGERWRNIETSELTIDFGFITCHGIPAIARAFGTKADALLFGGERAGVGKVSWPVFFTSQIGSPGCITIATVVKRAPCTITNRRIGRHQC